MTKNYPQKISKKKKLTKKSRKKPWRRYLDTRAPQCKHFFVNIPEKIYFFCCFRASILWFATIIILSLFFSAFFVSARALEGLKPRYNFAQHSMSKTCAVKPFLWARVPKIPKKKLHKKIMQTISFNNVLSTTYSTFPCVNTLVPKIEIFFWQ